MSVNYRLQVLLVQFPVLRQHVTLTTPPMFTHMPTPISYEVLPQPMNHKFCCGVPQNAFSQNTARCSLASSSVGLGVQFVLRTFLTLSIGAPPTAHAHNKEKTSLFTSRTWVIQNKWSSNVASPFSLQQQKMLLVVRKKRSWIANSGDRLMAHRVEGVLHELRSYRRGLGSITPQDISCMSFSVSRSQIK